VVLLYLTKNTNSLEDNNNFTGAFLYANYTVIDLKEYLNGIRKE
jgi:hypothetical protein